MSWGEGYWAQPSLNVPEPEPDKAPIKEFKGEFEFLSNFYRVTIETVEGDFDTAEHLFQASKTLIPAFRELIRTCGAPGRAKKLGKTVPLVENWDNIKIDVMREVLRMKFSIPEMREKLLATGDRELIEGNNWGDVFWGQVNGTGQNWLGKLLMEVRAEIRAEENTNAEQRTTNT